MNNESEYIAYVVCKEFNENKRENKQKKNIFMMMMIFSMNTNYNKQSNSDIFWLYKLISWQNMKLRFS